MSIAEGALSWRVSVPDAACPCTTESAPFPLQPHLVMDLPITTAASSPRPTPSPTTTATSATPAKGAPVFSPVLQALSPFSLASASSLPPAFIERRPSLSAPIAPLAPPTADRAAPAAVSACSSSAAPSFPSLLPATSASRSVVDGSSGATNMNGNHVTTTQPTERPLYEPTNILVTGGAGFMSALTHTQPVLTQPGCDVPMWHEAVAHRCLAPLSSHACPVDGRCSGSNVMIYLLTKYPHYRVVCLDKVNMPLTNHTHYRGARRMLTTRV